LCQWFFYYFFNLIRANTCILYCFQGNHSLLSFADEMDVDENSAGDVQAEARASSSTLEASANGNSSKSSHSSLAAATASRFKQEGKAAAAAAGMGRHSFAPSHGVPAADAVAGGGAGEGPRGLTVVDDDALAGGKEIEVPVLNQVFFGMAQVS
jgi:hypothetical protein